MARRRFIDPFELMLRRGNLAQLLKFFMRAEERLALAFPRSSRLLAESHDPSARQTRGSARRHYLHEALATAASDVGIPLETRWTDPATWSYPVIRMGGFSVTIGIVETKFRGAGRTLRSKAKYVRQLCERNAFLDPQTGLFDTFKPEDAVVADGALGGLIVAQYSASNPEVPAFLGFWVPSENLNSPYYVRSFDEIISMIRDRLALARRPSKRVIERTPLRLKKPGGKKA